MKTKTAILLLLIFLFTNCKQKSYLREESLPAHPNEINISGAFALAPLVQVWINEFQKINPKVKFELNTIGSGRGLVEVLKGRTDLAMVSSEIPRGIDSTLWVIPVARLAVVPIINNKNPYIAEINKKGITRDVLVDLFSGNNMKSWGDLYGNPGKDPIHVYYRSDSSGATDVLARYLWLQSKDMRGKGIDGEDKMIAAIKKDPLALGYCNFIYAFDPKSRLFFPELNVLPLDINNDGKIEAKENFYDSVVHLQRAMWVGKYPCALNRDLYLVSKVKPNTKEVVEFIKWVLTDGQRFVPEMGYIELHSSETQTSLNALK